MINCIRKIQSHPANPCVSTESISIHRIHTHPPNSWAFTGSHASAPSPILRTKAQRGTKVQRTPDRSPDPVRRNEKSPTCHPDEGLGAKISVQSKPLFKANRCRRRFIGTAGQKG
jgi:hypothetical protein